MKFIRKALQLMMPAFISLSTFAQKTPLKLWYKQPAGNTWEAALPIGNGFLGGMIYGNTQREIIKLNEGTVWSGGPNRNENPLAKASLPEIRKLIFEGKNKEAQQLASKTIQSPGINGMKFQPVGDLNIDFGHMDATDYNRELDIEKAVQTTTYTSNGVRYKRESFASLTDRVIVVRISADRPGSVSLNAFLNSLQKTTRSVSDKLLKLSGITEEHEGVKGQVKFETLVSVLPQGGTVQKTDTSILVKNATSVQFVISIATNYKNYKDISGDQQALAASYLQKALVFTYPALLKRHTNKYKSLFDRVKLELGETAAAHLPTDERINNFAKNGDPHLVNLYFQFGRYLLISSSQPGGQPANLQGIWNDKMSPPWDSKYTININTEMNYWPAENTNLSELHEPLIAMVKDLAQPDRGQETAKVMYGAGGWVAHHNTDLWRITGPVDPIYYAMWPMGGAWLSQHLYQKYLYSGNKTYLKEVYPVIRGAAQFFADFLVEEPSHGWLVVTPVMSPENSPVNRPNVSIDAGTTMDNQIIFELFHSTINAAEALGIDKEFSEKLKAMAKKLPPMQVGKHGQLQEWLEDLDNPKDNHRHISHLYGLFPANQISPYRNPELFSAARTTLEHRGDVSTGWSMGWKVNWWARLHDGNRAYKLITNQLSPLVPKSGGGGTYPNLFDAHPPFQIDGNFGCTAGIAEMLVQSHDGLIDILPALPDALPNGNIKGLRTRGGFDIVELEWKNGEISKLVVKSTLGGNLKLRSGNQLLSKNAVLKKAEKTNANPLFYVAEVSTPIIRNPEMVQKLSLKDKFEYDLSTQKGQVITLVKK